MMDFKSVISYFYNHCITGFLVLVGITFGYSLFPMKGLIQLIIYVAYVLICEFILLSLIFRCINFLSDKLDRFSTEQLRKYKQRKWKQLDDVEAFYSINWNDPSGMDLLDFLNKKGVHLSGREISAKLDRNMNLNSFELYEWLVNKFQSLAVGELRTIKEYTEVMLSIDTQSKSEKLKYSLLFVINIITLMFSCFFPVSNVKIGVGASSITLGSMKELLSPRWEVVILLILVFALTLVIAKVDMDIKRSKRIKVIHQALSDAYCFKNKKQLSSETSK